MRVIFMVIVIYCLLVAGCAPAGKAGKTRMSQKYHKKEYPRNQANINSLHYSTKKKKNKKPGFFDWLSGD